MKKQEDQKPETYQGETLEENTGWHQEGRHTNTEDDGEAAQTNTN